MRVLENAVCPDHHSASSKFEKLSGLWFPDAGLTSSKQNEHAEVYLSEGQETAKSVKLESNPEPEEDRSEAYSSDHDQSQKQVKAEAVERQIHSEEETV